MTTRAIDHRVLAMVVQAVRERFRVTVCVECGEPDGTARPA
jgi:hypothetical protein